MGGEPFIGGGEFCKLEDVESLATKARGGGGPNTNMFDPDVKLSVDRIVVAVEDAADIDTVVLAERNDDIRPVRGENEPRRSRNRRWRCSHEYRVSVGSRKAEDWGGDALEEELSPKHKGI